MFLRPVVSIVGLLVPVALILTACAAPSTDTATASRSGTASAARDEAPRVAGVTGKRVEVVAVGDIACRPGYEVTATTCRHAATARLTERIDPEAVLGLGDLQYDAGTLSAFRQSYGKSWGDLRNITYPTPGNHEYGTEGAAGYFDYFSRRTPDSPGYYAVDLGKWRAYSVNGHCSAIDCDEQARWLKRQLRRNESTCSLIATHYPRYSTGEHGDNEFMRRFFRIAFRHRVDVMLAGHDHHYERYKRMDQNGDIRKRGVMQFISGAGGKSHYHADGNAKGSQFVEDETFGVLRLVLRPTSYRFGFRGIDGSSKDNGTRRCV